MKDAEQETCWTGGMQERWEAGQVGCRKGERQERRDAGFRTGGMQESRDAG